VAQDLPAVKPWVNKLFVTMHVLHNFISNNTFHHFYNWGGETYWSIITGNSMIVLFENRDNTFLPGIR